MRHPLVLLASLALAATLLLTVGQAAPAQAAPGTWLSRINTFRAQNGVGPLTEDVTMDAVAQVWTQTMAVTNSLVHNPLLGQQVTLSWTRLAENIGYAGDEATLFQAYVNSPGHRANLLGPYNGVGIGQVVSGGLMWSTLDFVTTTSLLRPPPPPPPPPPPVVPVPPSAPVRVAATSTGSGGAVVTWGAPLSGDAPTSYTVTPSGGVPLAVAATSRTASFSALSGSALTFTVRASNGAGTSGPAASNAVDVSVPTPARDAVSDRQYHLTGSDGVTWVDVDAANLAVSYTPPASGQLVVDANIDLWTASPGVNQDVAVVVAGGAYGSGTVEGWKESGGFAGTFSPNAAAVNTSFDVTGGTAYTVKLQWKANHGGGQTIYAGGGPIGGGFSPTRLTTSFAPAAVTKRTDQFLLTDSDGTAWQPMSTTTAGAAVAPVTRTFTATADGVATITGNADLWTWNAKYNQDLGLRIVGGVYGAGWVVAWKESGGFAGGFSPNAALVEAKVAVAKGVDYSAELVWKANKPMPAGVRISAAAGAAGSYSPTTITVTQQATPTVAARMSASQYRLDGSDGATWQDLNTSTHDQAPFAATYTAPGDGYVHLIGNTDLWTYVAGYNQDIAIRVAAPPGDPGTAPNGIVSWKESGGYAGTFSPNAAAVEGYYPVKAGQTYTFTLVWKMNKPASPGVSISAGAGNPGSFSPTRLDLSFQPR